MADMPIDLSPPEPKGVRTQNAEAYKSPPRENAKTDIKKEKTTSAIKTECERVYSIVEVAVSEIGEDIKSAKDRIDLKIPEETTEDIKKIFFGLQSLLETNSTILPKVIGSRDKLRQAIDAAIKRSETPENADGEKKTEPSTTPKPSEKHSVDLDLLETINPEVKKELTALFGFIERMKTAEVGGEEQRRFAESPKKTEEMDKLLEEVASLSETTDKIVSRAMTDYPELAELYRKQLQLIAKMKVIIKIRNTTYGEVLELLVNSILNTILLLKTMLTKEKNKLTSEKVPEEFRKIEKTLLELEKSKEGLANAIKSIIALYGNPQHKESMEKILNHIQADTFAEA